MIRAICATIFTIACVGTSLPTAAEAATLYVGGFYDIGTGHFEGVDADENGVLTQYELTLFDYTFKLGKYGPFGTTEGNFELSGLFDPDMHVVASGTLQYQNWFCGGMLKPCDLYAAENPQWPLWEYAYLDWFVDTSQVFLTRVEYLTPAAVPVPATLPLLAGGVTALAVVRRRRRSTKG